MTFSINFGTQDQNDVGDYPASFGISIGITSIFNALLVVAKETNPHTILAWMNAAGNHWVTQSILDLVIFVVLGFALRALGQRWRFCPGAVIALAAGGVVLGSLIIAGFNLLRI